MEDPLPGKALLSNRRGPPAGVPTMHFRNTRDLYCSIEIKCCGIYSQCSMLNLTTF
jgi:hypothetical protein